MRKAWTLLVSLLVALTSVAGAQPAAAAPTNYTVTVVATGGSAENSSWTYANGEITPSASVSINASDLVSKLGIGSLVVNADRILVSASVTHATPNNLTFKATGNIIVGGGLTIQSQGGDVVFNSDSDADNVGHVRMGFDATCTMGNVNTNGGDIIVGGGANPRTTSAYAQNTDAHSTACLAAGPIAGFALYNYTLNAGGGDISIRAASPTIALNPSARGINMNASGGQVNTLRTTGAGTIYVYGDGSQILNNTAWGLAVSSPISVITDSGAITFEGRGNPSGPTNGRGVAIGGSSTFTSATGNVNFLDRTNGNGGSNNYLGIYVGGAMTVTTAGDFLFQADEIQQAGALNLDVNNATLTANTTASFSAVYSTGVINAANSNSLRIGSPGNTSAITLAAAVTSGGPLAITASTVTVNAAVTATNSPITFVTTGGVTQNSTITASALNLAGTATYNAQAFTVAGGSAQVVYLASFNAQGGSAIGPVIFSSGGSLTLPTPPTYAGYEFVGWYAAASSGVALVSPYSPSVAADITLYAQWIVEGTGAKIAAWTNDTVEQGDVVRLSFIGTGLSAVSKISSSTGSLRVVAKTDQRIDFEITDAALGAGMIRAITSTQDLTIAGAFVVVAKEPVRLATVSTRVSFSNSSATVSSIAKQQLLSSLKPYANAVSVVITGSVATSKATAATKALALKRAKAVAAIVAAQFPELNIQVAVAPAKSTASANNNAVVTLKVAVQK